MFTRVAANLLFSAFLYMSPFMKFVSPSGVNEAPDLDDPKEILYRELSDDAYFNLPCHKAESTIKPFRRLGSDSHAAYKHMDLNELNFEQANSQPALLPPLEVVDTDRYNNDLNTKTLKSLNPDAFTILHLCYAISQIYKRGRKGIHKYYNLRATYSDHLQFEIGYMTQAIMAKYQNVLELYEYSSRLEGPENKIGRPHLFFFYKNILEDCKLIIHLCNMMHEVTRKYRELQHSELGKPWINVIYDPSKKFQEKSGNYYRPLPGYGGGKDTFTRDFERGIEGFENEKYLHEKTKKLKKHRVLLEMSARRAMVHSSLMMKILVMNRNMSSSTRLLQRPAIFEKIKHAGMLEELEKHKEYKEQKPKRLEFLDFGTFTKVPSLATAKTRKTRIWSSSHTDPIEYGWSPEEDN